MSFKLFRLLRFFVQVTVGSLLFLLGILFIFIAFSSQIQNKIIAFVSSSPWFFVLSGVSLLLLSFALVIYAFKMIYRRHVQIRTGSLDIRLDESVIRAYLDAYWKKHFPESKIQYELIFERRRVKVLANLPYLPLEDQKTFLEKVKKDFNHLFGDLLGYPYDVHFIATFEGNEIV